MRASVFTAGREEEEIRALWHAARQKVLLDERWLQGLLGTRRPRLVLVAPESDGQTNADERGVAQLAVGPRVDWGDALDVPSFYGREQELATLAQWVLQERCRAVSVLGMGGIGKSALVTSAMRQWAAHFQVVLFRSLRDALPAKRSSRTASRCSPRSRSIWQLQTWNDAWASCWSIYGSSACCWCWTTWKSCSWKAKRWAICVPATRATLVCYVGSPKRRTRVACC